MPGGQPPSHEGYLVHGAGGAARHVHPISQSIANWIMEGHARLIESSACLRGELQTLGKLSWATQLSYQIHPIVSVDALALVNLDDRSTLVASGISWSASGSASLRLGTFAGLGAGPAGPENSSPNMARCLASAACPWPGTS